MTIVSEQTRWHRLYKFAPLVIILLYMRSQPEKPVTQIGISEMFDIDRKTAAAALRQLSAEGMIAHVDHNSGYILADGGQQMLMDLDAGWGKNGHLSLKESLIKDLKDSKSKKERRKGMGNFWTSPAGLTTERILAETGMLFGQGTISFGIADRDPSEAMSLVAHAYDQRGALSKPQVFVYRRLEKRDPADKKYRVDPLAFLPNDYLHALGLADLETVVIEAEAVEDVPQSLPALVESEAVRVWGQVQAQLQMEMPRGSFTSYVQTADVVRFAGEELVICASSAYARDWLESRLQSAVERLLIGIVSADVRVTFVSAETEVV